LNHLFRAKEGAEKSVFINSLDWQGILEVKSDGIYYTIPSPRTRKWDIANTVANFVVGLLSVVISAIATVILERPLAVYLSTTVARAWLWVLVGGLLVIGFGAWILGIFGLIFGFVYLIDFLTLPAKARSSRPTAVLKIKEARMGHLRHVLKVSVEKELVPLNLQRKEYMLTVIATRRGLRNALRQVVTETPVS
jgi:hypothetical protein